MGFFAFLSRKSSNRSLNTQTPRNVPPSRQSSTFSFGKSPLAISRSVQELRREYDEPIEPQFCYTVSTEESSTHQQPNTGQRNHLHDARPSTAPTYDDEDQLHQQRLQSRPAGRAPPKRASALLPQRGIPATSAQALRSVDLLDARGRLCPSDFRERLAAAGSREYGEDVADRNIGENGLILSSSSVQNFYATRPPSRLSLTKTPPQRSVFPNVVHPGRKDRGATPTTHTGCRPLHRSASAHHHKHTTPTNRPNSTDGSRQAGEQLANRTTLINRRSSVISIGQPKLECPVQEAAPKTEGQDPACPPTVPRYRRPETDSEPRHVTQTESSDVYQPSSPTHPTSQRGHLPIDNIHFWGAPHTGDENETARNQRATSHWAGTNTSIRDWSISSTAPATECSETSSVLNVRSHSRCTANTSIDLESVPENDEETTEKEPNSGTDVVYIVPGAYETDLSYTTDGSDIDSFVQKRRRKAVPDGEALLFKEAGFQDGGGNLPGLFGRLHALIPSMPPPVAETVEESEDNGEEGESNFSVQTPESANENLVPGMYLTQRQRMLALGFDYDTDDEELADTKSETYDDAPSTQSKNIAQPAIQSSIVDSAEDKQSENTKARMALNLRREVKKYKRSSVKPRRVCELDGEADGNLADVE